MALKKSIEKTIDGFDGILFVKDAYWRVESIAGNKTTQSVSVIAYRNDKIVGQFTTKFAPDMEGDNFIKQAYKHLKTLPEFVGAVDC